jgi:hypothetical protein
MAKRYKMLRVPMDVWEKWFQRKSKIQNKIVLITHKPQQVSLTNVLRFYGHKKMDIWDDELLNFFGKKQKKRNFGSEIL